MKSRFIPATITLSVIVFWVFEDINAINKYRPAIFSTIGYIQDTPKLDSVKRHLNKHTKKIKLNKDSIKRFKKDTV